MLASAPATSLSVRKLAVPDRIQIRRFRPSHLRRILQIERDAFPLESYTRDMFMELYDCCGELFFVAKCAGRIAGYMVTCVRAKDAEIVSIAVDPKYRNGGVGKALMEHAFATLKAARVRRVTLTVRPTNRVAIRFYRGLGFTRVGRLAQYYPDGADALQMQTAFSY